MAFRRLRFWLILATSVILLILGFLVAGLMYRERGFDRLEQLQADRKAAGRMATLADLIDSLPPVDVPLQQRWHTWSERMIASWKDPQINMKAWQAWVAGNGPISDKLIAYLERRRPEMEAGLNLLRQPGLRISAAGFIRQDLSGETDYNNASRIRCANLLVMRELAQWLAWSAVMAPDPTPRLNDLDLIEERCQPTITIIDAAIQMDISRCRNAAYLEASIRCRNSSTRSESFLQKTVDPFRSLGEALQGEALVFILAYASTLRQSSYIRDHHTGSPTSLPRTVSSWLKGPQGCAMAYGYVTAHLDDLTGLPLLTDKILDREYYKNLNWMPVPNIEEFIFTAWSIEAGQRATQAALVLMEMEPAGLPFDAADTVRFPVLAHILEPPGGFHLLYEHLGNGRIRISVHPASPVPPLFPSSWLKHVAKFASTPPGKAPYLRLDSTGIELDLSVLHRQATAPSP